MKFYAILIITLIIVSGCGKSHDTTQFDFSVSPEFAGFSIERLNRLDTLLENAVADGLLPNAVTFVARGGKVVHHKAFGYSNLESQTPVQKDNLFRMASQTKAITSVALMTLYEEGYFLLDDPVSLYIPEFRNMQVLDVFNDKDTTFTTRPASREITIRHLLTHTSGIHYGILGGGSGNMMYTKAGIPAVNSMDSLTVEQVVKRIAEMPLFFDPGNRYYYGMNTDVVGYLIEVLSGKRFDLFLEERIFNPLGMNNTHFYLPEDKHDRLVELYTSSPEGLVVHVNQVYRQYPVAGAKMFLSGGAGLIGPIEDYARFCQMILNKGKFNGQRILGRKTVDLMLANQIGDLTIGRGTKFGLGFELRGEQGLTHHLGSEGTYRWGGMYYTDYLIDPREDMILLFYTNVQPYRGKNFHELFHNLVYQSLE
jgi:CubicO group peptidase (beta-lactamase class C family)